MTDDKKNEDVRQTKPQRDVEPTPATDPQKRMEGPISSLMHSTGDSFDTEETKPEADETKEERM